MCMYAHNTTLSPLFVSFFLSIFQLKCFHGYNQFTWNEGCINGNIQHAGQPARTFFNSNVPMRSCAVQTIVCSQIQGSHSPHTWLHECHRCVGTIHCKLLKTEWKIYLDFLKDLWFTGASMVLAWIKAIESVINERTTKRIRNVLEIQGKA